MSNDSGFGVPAGWYPDPLGLPQMRWWDNHGWTEHTTEARAPIVIQETTFAWADDEAPTRRERRERERDDDFDSATVPPVVPTAEALLQLEPPSWDSLPANEPAPVQEQAAPARDFSDFHSDQAFTHEATRAPAAKADGFASAASDVHQADAHTSSVANTGHAAASAATGYSPDLDFAQFRATAHDSAFSAQTATAVADGAAPRATRATAAGRGDAPLTPHSPSAWIIALIPLLQLVLTLLVVSSVGAAGSSVEVMLGIWLAPYFAVIPLAFVDRRALVKSGYENPASWLWSFLGAPVYLIARAISIVMRAGNGFGPILVWGALALLQVGSIVAVPGLVISALPAVFTAEAEESIRYDATVFGPLVSVKCPSPPATVIGQQFTCTLTRPGAPVTNVTASLQRANGWIAWRVEDWGMYTTGN